ncbi:MAG: hypothetical protein AAFY78_12355 [Cyanobacteria bacterium J06648_16]
MKPVSDLYNRHPDSDIYVVGTGASLRVFPTDFLTNKLTIGLNMAWKLVPVTYGITIHPDLNVPEFMADEAPHPDITWVTKRAKSKALLTAEEFEYADGHFYYFEMNGQANTQPPHQPSDEGRILDWVRQPTENYLYQWSSISQTGVNLAANLGAKNIILVGCDNCAILGNHHAHNQHTAWKGVDPQERYQQYYEGLAEVRTALRERGINLLSMTPFLSLESPQNDFQRLCQELNRPDLIKNADVTSSLDTKTMAIKRTSSDRAVPHKEQPHSQPALDAPSWYRRMIRQLFLR